MLTREENELLCRVGRDTPMGRMMRRYWLPAAGSDELETGGAPKLVRLLGERFVAFRDQQGRVGMLDENCPHRGASLLLARNEECGLRCLYHGWKFDVEGCTLETPPEPDDLNFKEKVRAPSYPVREAGGLIWTYLGPPGTQPAPMNLEFEQLPASHRMILRMRQQTNWVQGVEGVLDNAHLHWLHKDALRTSDGIKGTVFGANAQLRKPSDDAKPRIEVQDTAYGFRYAAIRRPNENPDTTRYVRVALFVAPYTVIFPSPKGWGSLQIWVPLDDECSMLYFLRYKYEVPITDAEREDHWIQSGMRPGVNVIPEQEWRTVANASNLWMQDRKAMERGDHHTGIYGVNVEDMAAQESMGPIYDRTKEHLGTSDIAIIRLRRRMIDAARGFEKGEPPLGLGESVPYDKLHAEEGIIAINAPWQMLGAFAGESVEPEGVTNRAR